MLGGAKACDELTRRPIIKENPAAQLALMWYYIGNGKGSKNMVILPYKDRLELFSKYLQQLVMESLGKKLQGNVLTVQLDPTWQKVMKIGGIKDYVKLFSADEKTEGEHEETIKEEQQIIFAGFLPDKAVEPGQRWQRKSSHESHKPTANYTAVEDYIYRGKEAVADRDADHIDAAWTVTFVPPKLEGVEVKQDLKADPAKARYFFDSGAGRLVKSERSFHVKGKWTLIYQGKEIVTEVDQDENWRIRLTDENPLGREK